jgi:hypothetical protein
MVRALLAGTKTQTRRLLREVPEGTMYFERQMAAPTCIDAEPGTVFWRPRQPDGIGAGILCPYGAIGDVLWVKERHRFVTKDTGLSFTQSHVLRTVDRDVVRVVYAADEPETKYRTRPSIHMPFWASRIHCRLREIRIERLQDLTEEDARAEGICLPWRPPDVDPEPTSPHRSEFAVLWNKLNGSRATWASNPFVWVLRFEGILPGAALRS